MKDLISIIIPTFNVENYIRECLKSILNQTYINFELIIIDDHSTDDTINIIKNMAKIDRRIKLFINEKNEGCAFSRNLGLRFHKGKYITYIDADDFVMEEYLEKLYNNLKKFNADISICQHKKVSNTKRKHKSSSKASNIKVLNSDEAICYLSRQEKFSVALWGKLFKSEVFDDEQFPLTKSASDCFVMYKLLNKSKKIVFDDSVKYLYRKVMTSITHRKNEINLDLIYETKKVLLYVEDNIFTQYNNLKYRYIKNLLITYNKMLYNCKYNKEVENFIKKEILNFYDKNNFNIIENIQIKLFLNESCLYKLFFSKRYEVIK